MKFNSKDFENQYKIKLEDKKPVVIRIDGIGFSGMTKRHFKMPLDPYFTSIMQSVAWNIASEMEGCKYVYAQSDEISFILNNDDKENTSAWFGNNLQKMVSTTVAKASVLFNEHSIVTENCYFDGRAFSLPDYTSVGLYLKERYDNSFNNAICTIAADVFSHKERMNKPLSEILMMLNEVEYDLEIFSNEMIFGTLMKRKVINQELNRKNIVKVFDIKAEINSLVLDKK